jgi:hypothetical protein
MVILEEYHDCKTAEEAKERVKEWVNRLSPPVPSNLPPTIHCNTCKKCGKTFTRHDNLQRHILHLFTFQTPILTAKKNKKKCKINGRNFTYDGLTFSSSGFILEEVKDEI